MRHSETNQTKQRHKAVQLAKDSSTDSAAEKSIKILFVSFAGVFVGM